jgi:hypothetical protein
VTGKNAEVTGKNRPENGCSPRRFWLSDFEVTGKNPFLLGCREK